MTAHVERDAVMAQLRAEDVAQHLGIKGQWRGRWMRSARCAETDHASDAFGLARDGKWHCWSCDKGGDLLLLLALGEGLDPRADFPKILEIAAGIAGVELEPGADLFGTGPVKPDPKPRPAPPPIASISERIAIAKRRAWWAWDRLHVDGDTPSVYLRSRGLDPDVILSREELRYTPLRLTPDLRAKIDSRDPDISDDTRTLWYTMGTRRGTLSMVIPVRSANDGAMVDLRARRLEPEPGQPKIIGMVGGVTSAPAERGRGRQLVGCYGRPYAVDADHVVITEGAMDYLTALQVWPNAQVLGAVEAGSLAIVTAWAAQALAARDSDSRLTIVEQSDPPRVLKDGRTVAGAADASINEDPNAATKVAIRLLGPRRVGWLLCKSEQMLEGNPVKDLNDLVRVGADIAGMLTWWSDVASADR